MSFAIVILRVVLFVFSILFGLAGLEAGPYTTWVDSCLLNSIILNIVLLLDLCIDENEDGILHLPIFGIFVLAMILMAHVYGA